MPKFFSRLLTAAMMIASLSPLYASATVLPSTTLSNFKAQADSAQITGSFLMTDHDASSIGDLNYTVSVAQIDSVRKEVRNYAEVSGTPFGLTSGEQKTISFTYPLVPGIMSGKYTLSVRVLNSKGLIFGVLSKELTITTQNKGLIATGARLVVKGTSRPALEGSSVTTGSNPKATLSLVNTTDTTITASPKLTIYLRDVHQTPTSQSTLAQVTVKPGATVPMSVDLPSDLAPQSYIAKIEFTDAAGKNVANTVYVRFVIEGASGQIVLATAGQSTACDTLPVTVTYAGRADAKPSTSTSNISVTVKDERGVVIGSAAQDTPPGGGKTVVDVPMKGCVASPTIMATLSSGGKVLDTYTITIPPSKQAMPAKQDAQPPVLIILVALALIGLIFALIHHKRTVIVALMVVASGLAFGGPHQAFAVTEEISDPALTISWSLPYEGQTFKRGDTLPIEATVQNIYCFNAAAWSQIKLWYEWPGDATTRTQRQIATQRFNSGHEGDANGWDLANSAVWGTEVVSTTSVIPSDAPKGPVRVYMDIQIQNDPSATWADGQLHHWLGYVTINIQDSANNQSTNGPVTASLYSEPTTIVTGQTSNLTWSSTGATTCTGDLFDTGTLASGQVIVQPSVTTTYQLNCSDGSKTATAFATVVVDTTDVTSNLCASNKGQSCTSDANSCGQTDSSGAIQCNGTCSSVTPPNFLCPAPALAIIATPHIVRQGSSINVTWSSTNAQNCSVTGPNGFTGTGTSGVKPYGPVDQTAVFTLRCEDPRSPGTYLTATDKVNVTPKGCEIGTTGCPTH